MSTSPDDHPDTLWAIDPARVMWEALDGEAVIIDLVTGHYHAASDVALTIWQALQQPTSDAELLVAVHRRHDGVPDDAASSVRTFREHLVERGLVVARDAADTATADTNSAGTAETDVRDAWSPPTLESHDDLEDLLLLDPVHDVTEAGWPNVRVPET